jgi:predicted O-methyltransferase YrrM
MKSLVHLVRFLVGLDSAASQVTARELQLLLRYSRDASVICEIGCYEASTSVAFALNTAGRVYSVDPFIRGRMGICYTECIARAHRWRAGAQNLIFLKGMSLDIGPTFDLPIDFLFIDADHSYEAAKADWKQWFPKVRRNGYIALHDSKLAPNSPQPLGSMRFYSEDLVRMERVVECGSVDSLVIVQSQELKGHIESVSTQIEEMKGR